MSSSGARQRRQFWTLHEITIKLREKPNSNITLQIALEDRQLLWTRKETASADAEFVDEGKEIVRWTAAGDIKEFRFDTSSTCDLDISVRPNGLGRKIRSKVLRKALQPLKLKILGKQIHDEVLVVSDTMREYTHVPSGSDSKEVVEVKFSFEVHTLSWEEFTGFTNEISDTAPPQE